ncbi:hypothetical protein B0H63DRAFT_473809 [Podospora didyma]|uniref:FAD-binding domain-containing protein n=1 Tax=Podospora didyma TaxID=330526 RepID=A0AAE0NQN3_9PEZI|nr:hypothetical protein B0H63DRAFT_473809 [Podospora didyma]
MLAMESPPRPRLRVLISGAGIAGPALALWLSRINPSVLECDITIVERSQKLRASGHQIDLRDQGIPIMKKMGLEEAVRARLVREPGLQLLNRKGKVRAYLEANTSGKGSQGFTSEYEIMRGDLCEILYQATKDAPHVRYIFGCSVESFTQDEARGTVRVRFSGSGGGEGVPKGEKEFDLLVGADGVGSRIRHAMLGGGDAGKDAFKPINYPAALFTVPAQDGDTLAATMLHLPGRRLIMTRKDQPDSVRVFMGFVGKDPELDEVLKSGTMAEKKQMWVSKFTDDAETTWQLPRYLGALLNSPMADDLYTLAMGQVKMDTWSKGRVVLLGDAGYCASPVSGLGVTISFAGAYVLGGEIARACGNSATPAANIPIALAAYERELRPFIKDAQVLPPGYPGFMVPASKWGIKVLHSIAWLITTTKIHRLAMMFASEKKGGWKVPEYKEFET